MIDTNTLVMLACVLAPIVPFLVADVVASKRSKVGEDCFIIYR